MIGACMGQLQSLTECSCVKASEGEGIGDHVLQFTPKPSANIGLGGKQGRACICITRETSQVPQGPEAPRLSRSEGTDGQ